MAKGISNTQRTLRALRQEGCIYGIVERFNPYAGPHGVRVDLFHFIDIIALYPTGICAIQSTGQGFAEHERTILENEIAPEWLKAGGMIELWGWRKLKVKRGGKAMRWVPRKRTFTLEDFAEHEAWGFLSAKEKKSGEAPMREKGLEA